MLQSSETCSFSLGVKRRVRLVAQVQDANVQLSLLVRGASFS